MVNTNGIIQRTKDLLASLQVGREERNEASRRELTQAQRNLEAIELRLALLERRKQLKQRVEGL